MEVVCRDTLSGNEHFLDVCDGIAVLDLVEKACALFDRTAVDLTLAVAGKELTDPLSETALEGDSLVEIVRSNARVLRLVREGTEVNKLPGWAAGDKEVVLAALEHTIAHATGDFSLEWAAEELRADREVVLKCVGSAETAWMLQEASEELRDDDEVVLVAVANDGCALEHASDRLRRDRRVVLTAVKQAGDGLEYADEVFRSDKEIVLCAVKDNGKLLETVSVELRNDKEVALAAVRQDGTAIKYVSEELRADLHVGLVAITCEPEAIEFMPELTKVKEIMLAVVRNDPGARQSLMFASPEMRDDKQVVLLAVSRCGESLAYASERLRDDKDVVLAALKKDSSVSGHASARLLQDVDVFVASGSHYGTIGPEFAHFSNDKEAVMKFLASNSGSSVLKFVDDNLRADKEVVVAACSKNGYDYASVPDEMKEDRDVLLSAAHTKHGSLSWKEVPAKWKSDPEVALASVYRNIPEALVPELIAVIGDTREAQLAAVKRGGSRLLDAVKAEFQTDKDFLMAAVKLDGARALPLPSLQGVIDREVLMAAVKSGMYYKSYRDVHLNFSAAALDDKDVVLALVLQDACTLKHASDRLKADPDVLETARLRKGVTSTGEYLVSLDEVAFPLSTGLQINMMPFLMEPLFDLTRLPENLREYWTVMVKPLLGVLKGQHGTVCYLSVDERDVVENESHRRGGLHTESPGRLLKDAFLNGYDIGSAAYTNNLHWGYSTATLNGGLFVASNVADSCAAWDCAVTGAEEGEPLIKPHGDIEHLRPTLEAIAKEERLEANRMYWMTDRTPHESLPLKKACHRQWFRLVTSAVSAWFVDHSTPNPNGVVPDPDITITLKGNKFDVKNLELLGAGNSGGRAPE